MSVTNHPIKAKEDDIAAITKLENDQVKADLARNLSYYETNLSDDFKDLRDTSNNRIYKSGISNITIHLYVMRRHSYL